MLAAGVGRLGFVTATSCTSISGIQASVGETVLWFELCVTRGLYKTNNIAIIIHVTMTFIYTQLSLKHKSCKVRCIDNRNITVRKKGHLFDER